jgi:DUF971 family protein
LRAFPERRGLDMSGAHYSQDSMQPTDIELTDDHTALVMTWPGGETCRLGAEQLRRASRAASEIRRQIDGLEPNLPSGLRVDAYEPVGNYALRLFFSDGHDRGIYPWPYFRELAGLAGI